MRKAADHLRTETSSPAPGPWRRTPHEGSERASFFFFFFSIDGRLRDGRPQVGSLPCDVYYGERFAKGRVTTNQAAGMADTVTRASAKHDGKRTSSFGSLFSRA